MTYLKVICYDRADMKKSCNNTINIIQKENGQALLIMVLVMAVALTIGLAVISRSITDIKISRQEEQSARVFSAAEAGIEEALKAGAAPPDFAVNNIDVKVKQAGQGGGRQFAFPQEVNQGDVQTIWLVNHTAGGDLDLNGGYSGSDINVYWGNEGTADTDPTTPALEVTVIYTNSGFKVGRYAYDPNMTRGTTSRFAAPLNTGTFTVDGKKFRYMAAINLPTPVTRYYALRLRLLFNNVPHLLGVEAVGVGNLPSQGMCYDSTAKDPGTGATNRVQQCQFYKAPPGIFDYVLFSEGDLAK